jgi:hypothetical protein
MPECLTDAGLSWRVDVWPWSLTGVLRSDQVRNESGNGRPIAARGYGGHEGGLAGAVVTAAYLRADLEEVAAALAGEPHPLAPTTARGLPGRLSATRPRGW